MLEVEKIRQDFPILSIKGPNRKPLVYLDNAASTQKPMSVIQAIENFYRKEYANIHRGIYTLAVNATKAYEQAREKAKAFFNAKSYREIIFVRGATEGINLVAQCFTASSLNRGDEVLITTMEHHSNLIPWQMLCKTRGAKLRVLPLNEKGELALEELPNYLTGKTKMLALTHISNTLGTINPIKQIVALAHQKGIPVLVDGAQSAGHYPVDVQDLDCDFFVCSGHKMFGPTGIGILYGKRQHLKSMPPYQFGGEMIRSVSFEKTTFADLPQRFEGGTPNIVGAVGLGFAMDYIRSIGRENIKNYLQSLLIYATERIKQVEGVKIIGEAKQKSSIISFTMAGVHPHDIATIINEEGVAVRAGHHCTQPLMDSLSLPATTRASFSIYNTKKEVDLLVNALRATKKVFSY